MMPVGFITLSCDRRPKLFHLMLKQHAVVTANEITLHNPQDFYMGR